MTPASRSGAARGVGVGPHAIKEVDTVARASGRRRGLRGSTRRADTMAGMIGRYSSIKSAVLLTAVAIATTACAAAAARPAVRPSPFPRAAGGSDDTTMPRPVAAPAPTPAPSLAARHLLDTAVGLRGVSYRLGGEDPGSGFDCSGFVRYVFAQHHVVLPRTVVEQFGAAHDIAPDEIARRRSAVLLDDRAWPDARRDRARAGLAGRVRPRAWHWRRRARRALRHAVLAGALGGCKKDLGGRFTQIVKRPPRSFQSGTATPPSRPRMICWRRRRRPFGWAGL